MVAPLEILLAKASMPLPMCYPGRDCLWMAITEPRTTSIVGYSAEEALGALIRFEVLAKHERWGLSESGREILLDRFPIAGDDGQRFQFVIGEFCIKNAESLGIRLVTRDGPWPT